MTRRRLKPSDPPPPSAPIDLSHIAPGLRPLATAVETLQPDPRNARRHDEKNLKAIADSLRRFGQVKPIVVDADGVVLAGNGTVEAARRLRWTHIAAARTELRGADARAFALADNRSAELAEWDVAELLAQVDELEDAHISLDELGFADDDLDQLRKDLDKLEQGGGPGAAKSSSRGNGNGGDVANGGGAGWKIMVTCRDEAEQRSLLEELDGRGLSVRALGGIA